MNENQREPGREELEDLFMQTAQKVSDGAYEKYLSGELSSTDLQRLYSLIRQWMSETEELLEFVG